MGTYIYILIYAYFSCISFDVDVPEDDPLGIWMVRTYLCIFIERGTETEKCTYYMYMYIERERHTETERCTCVCVIQCDACDMTCSDTLCV